MRVIWITSVLLFGLIAFGISTYFANSYSEGDASQPLSIISNPFVDDEFDENSITLAVLPGEQDAVDSVDGSDNATIVNDVIVNDDIFDDSIVDNASRPPEQGVIIAGAGHPRAMAPSDALSDVMSDVMGREAQNINQENSDGTVPGASNLHSVESANVDGAVSAKIENIPLQLIGTPGLSTSNDIGNNTSTNADDNVISNVLGNAVSDVNSNDLMASDNEKIAIIVNVQNKQDITKAELKNIYMNDITHWRDGSKIALYNLPLGDKWREKFSRGVLNMSALDADRTESNRKSVDNAFSPGYVKAKNIIVSYIERNPHAIAYVPLSAVKKNSQVNVLMTLP